MSEKVNTGDNANNKIGEVFKIFNRLKVVGVKVLKPFTNGDKLKIVSTNGKEIEITVNSIEIDRQKVTQVNIGDRCGLELGCSNSELPSLKADIYQIA